MTCSQAPEFSESGEMVSWSSDVVWPVSKCGSYVCKSVWIKVYMFFFGLDLMNQTIGIKKS